MKAEHKLKKIKNNPIAKRKSKKKNEKEGKGENKTNGTLFLGKEIVQLCPYQTLIEPDTPWRRLILIYSKFPHIGHTANTLEMLQMPMYFLSYIFTKLSQILKCLS